MAEGTVNVKELVEKRIAKIDKKLDSLTEGSREHTLAVSDLKKMVDSWTNIEERRITEEDNVAKREEQKRVNDEEIKQRDYEASVEMLRYEADKDYKIKQLKLSCAEVLTRAMIGGFALGTQGLFTRSAMIQEYGVSGGSSIMPPKSIDTQLRRFDPFIKK